MTIIALLFMIGLNVWYAKEAYKSNHKTKLSSLWANVQIVVSVAVALLSFVLLVREVVVVLG